MTDTTPALINLATAAINGPEFYKTHPAENPFTIPLGEAADGSTYNFTLAETSVVGRTAAGKESIIHGLIYQLAPFIAEGSVKIYLGDHKPSASMPYYGTSLCHRIAREPEDILTMVDDFLSLMKEQRTTTNTTIEATPEHPAHILILDEMADLVVLAGQKNNDGATLTDKLTEIAKEGASQNCYLVALSQTAFADTMGRLIKSTENRFAGYLKSPYETAKALNITEDEVMSNRNIVFPIPASNRANGYRYSGIFTVSSDEGFTTIRVPYINPDTDVAARAAEFGLDKRNAAEGAAM